MASYSFIALAIVFFSLTLMIPFVGVRCVRELVERTLIWIVECVTGLVNWAARHVARLVGAMTPVLVPGCFLACVGLAVYTWWHRPLPDNSIVGRVVDADGSPISEASVELATNSVLTDTKGWFAIRVHGRTEPGTPLKVSHAKHITYFARYDSLVSLSSRPIILRNKPRLLVAEFEQEDPADGSFDTELLRRSSEDWLAHYADIEVATEVDRKKVLDILYKNQERRITYDEASLQKIGKLIGATHGVFGRVTSRNSGKRRLECSFISLRSGKKEAAANEEIPEDGDTTSVAQQLLDRLLARWCQVGILDPPNGTPVPLRVPVHGYSVFKPESWSIWITVQPLDNDRYYPQSKVVVQKDGAWLASGVQVGKEGDNSDHPVSFAINALLVDPMANGVFDQYFDAVRNSHGSNEGLDISRWEEDELRKMDQIVVVPQR